MRLFKESWGIYLFLLMLCFSVLFLLGQAIPLNVEETNASLSTTNVSESNILDLLIPYNLFRALTDNYVPAIIVFCILFGFALQFIPQKMTFMNTLETISATSLLFWNGLVKFAPLAAFALLANIMGVTTATQLMNISEFLILFFIGSVLLIFWMIPIVISCFTGIPYRSILFELRDALIISSITTLSVVSLPYIRIMTSRFIEKETKQAHQEERENMIKTITLMGYPFAQLGNFFIYIFILFALFYFNHAITRWKYWFLLPVTYLSSIGSPSTSVNAVSFISSWLGLPSQTTSLYISFTPLIRYAQVLVSVMGFAFLALLVSFALFHRLKLNYKKLLIHLGLAFSLLILIMILLKNYFPYPGEKSYERLNSFTINPNLTKNVKAIILPSFNETEVTPVENAEDSLFRIQKTGVLRVGFNADMRPFVFYNKSNQLVGYDVEYAYALADTLNSRIEFIPFNWEYLVQDLMADKFDIAIGAIYVTALRLKDVNFTRPYLRSPISLIVPSGRQHQFHNVEQMTSMKELRIGVFKDPVLIPLVQKNLPNAKIVILPSISSDAPLRAFEQNQIDAVLWSQAQTQVWVMAHRDYRSIIPVGLAAPFLMAYMVNRNSPQFLNFLNYWLELRENDGFQQVTYDKWLLILPSELKTHLTHQEGLLD